jgi:hypothetical protein
MADEQRSEQACPVCGQHTLALDAPPRIDVMGVQTNSDMLGMGDLKAEGTVGIVCLSCDTHWRDKAAFDRNDSEPVDDTPLDDEFDPADFEDPADDEAG